MNPNAHDYTDLTAGEEINQPIPPLHEGEDCNDDDDPCQRNLEATR